MLIRLSPFYWLMLSFGVDQIVTILLVIVVLVLIRLSAFYWLKLCVGVDQIVSILLVYVELWC